MGDDTTLRPWMHNFRTGQAEASPEQFTDENVRDYMPQSALHWNIYCCERELGKDPAHALIAVLEADVRAYEAASR